MKLYLIRHGKTKGNLEKRYIGRTDESLCQQGIAELQKNLAGGIYAGIEKTDFLFVSPKKRCIETAALLLPWSAPISVQQFQEIDFGKFEGKNYQELSGDASYQAWIDSNGQMPFPGGESREAFIRRCQQGFEQAVGRMENQGEQTLTATMVVHGGTIMSLLSTLGGRGDYYDYQCGNGCGYLCEMELSAGRKNDKNRNYRLHVIRKIEKPKN